MKNRGHNAAGARRPEKPSPVVAPSSRRRWLLPLGGLGFLACAAVILVLAGPSWWKGAAPPETVAAGRKAAPQVGGNSAGGAPESKMPPGPAAGTAESASSSPAKTAAPGESPEAMVAAARALKSEAIAVARQLMEDFPDSSDAIGLMGSVFMRFTETAEAAKWWQKCIEANPRRADAYHGLAKIAYLKGDREQAVELWHKAQAINPNVPGTHGALGKALVELGQFQEAIVELEKEIRLTPTDPESYYLTGQAYFRLQQYEKAAETYQKAVSLSPEDSRPYYGLATSYARLGQADKARECMEKFKTAKAREEDDATHRLKTSDDRGYAGGIAAQTHADAGKVYAGHRRFKEAEQHWQRAAAIDPKNRAARQSLVELYRSGGRLAEAVPICEQLRELEPQNPTYHLNTGVIYGELQRYDDAEAEIRKAIELNPTYPCAHRTLVRLMLVRNERLPEARILAQKLVALEPTAGNYVILGEACRRAGDAQGAREAAKRVMELAPGGVNAGGASLGLQP